MRECGGERGEAQQPAADSFLHTASLRACLNHVSLLYSPFETGAKPLPLHRILIMPTTQTLPAGGPHRRGAEAKGRRLPSRNRQDLLVRTGSDGVESMRPGVELAGFCLVIAACLLEAARRQRPPGQQLRTRRGGVGIPSPAGDCGAVCSSKAAITFPSPCSPKMYGDGYEMGRPSARPARLQHLRAPAANPRGVLAEWHLQHANAAPLPGKQLSLHTLAPATAEPRRCLLPPPAITFTPPTCKAGRTLTVGCLCLPAFCRRHLRQHGLRL